MFVCLFVYLNGRERERERERDRERNEGEKFFMFFNAFN